MDIGPFHLPDVLVSFPDSQTVVITETVNGQNGSLGSELLRRFNLILDYPDKKIHIIANNAFEDEFHYDMSGLEIRIPVPMNIAISLAGIRTQSRAEGAGIRPGDEILSINGTPHPQLNLDEIYKLPARESWQKDQDGIVEGRQKDPGQFPPGKIYLRRICIKNTLLFLSYSFSFAFFAVANQNESIMMTRFFSLIILTCPGSFLWTTNQ